MWPSIIAVAGTLAGVALASLTQHAVHARDRRERQQQAVADAVAGLLAAALTYREVFWLQLAAARDGHTPGPEDRAAIYSARTAVTGARDRLGLATADPGVILAADEAAWSAIELSDIPLGRPDGAGRFTPDIEQQLDTARTRARNAHTALRNVGAAHVHLHRTR